MIDIRIIGIQDFELFLTSFPHVAEKAAAMAINQVADRSARVGVKREIMREVAFPSSYLNSSRLGVSKKAAPNKLEAIVVGRDKATSLARFVVGGERSLRSKRRGNLRVEVKPGSSKNLRGAWGVRLKNGNVGLAVRSKTPIRNSKTGGRSLDRDVYLLYAPSVDQVMPGAVDVVSPEISRSLMVEFTRQLNRLSR